MSNFKEIIENGFTQYAGAVLQSRALIDVRDGLKPSARQILYALYTDKFYSNKPYKKTLKALGSLARFYIHGDASGVGVLMRAGQPFAMRYPLTDVKGNYGTLMKSGNWASQRYTETRLSPLIEQAFEDIEKETIEEWRDNYDDTEQYPSVIPSKGYYNICNGTMGIGIGMASSIPQYNLNEMNKALETLLLNPDCEFEDIYIAPDFATGATLLNETQVKESMKNGKGFACKLRSKVDFDKKENCFVVTEIPYGVYTNTICGELEEILLDETNPGVERFNDLTGKTALIKIYLKRNANPNKILKYLFKNTSLESHYSINFTMLDKGRFPKVFTWKEMLQAHIDHEKEVYRRGFEFDLRKIEARLHIIEALLKVIAEIDEVVQLIKTAPSTAVARDRLMERFELDSAQAKAVLDIKLSRLAHLEVQKLENEKVKLEKEQNLIYNIIRNEELFNQELIKGWREVAQKFGDSRRTKILNLESNEDEIQEKFLLSVNLTNKNNIFLIKESSLFTQRRGGVGKKFKMDKDEYIISTTTGVNSNVGLFFSNIGMAYHVNLSSLPIEETIPVESLFKLSNGELIKEITTLDKNSSIQNIIFFTKHGLMKKSLLSEYNINRNSGIKAIHLEENDEIESIIFTDKDNVGMLTAGGQFVYCTTEDVRPIGRVTKGVKGVKLNLGDTLISAKAIKPEVKEIITISENGLIKRTDIKEFSITGKNTKGGKIQKLNTGDSLVDFLPISNEQEVLIVSTSSQIKIKVSEIPKTTKNAQGARSIKISNGKIIGISKF